MNRVALATSLLAVTLLTGCVGTPRAASTSTRSTALTVEETPKSVALIDVVGRPYSDAQNSLSANGYSTTLDTPDEDADHNSDFYEVVTQDPAAGTQTAPGSTVTLHIKPILVPVPKVVGEDYSDAKSAIEESNGNLSAKSTQDADANGDWIVKTQTPAGGSSVKAGTEINLTLQAPQVVFTITGNGFQSNVITYTIPGSLNIEQASSAALPWSKSFPYTGSGLMPNGNISAQDYDGTSITCTIAVAGHVVDTQTATGPYAIVQCGG